MSRIKWCLRVFPVIFLSGLLCFLGQQAYGADRPAQETRQVQVKVGDKSKTFSWAELQAFPLRRLNGYEPLGTKKGPLGRHDWEGVSLAQLILAVDPLAGQAGQRDQRIVVRSQDGWQALFAWEEVFGEPKGGEALYRVKGCNECHGLDGESADPWRRLKAPGLRNRNLALEKVSAVIRSGGKAHGGTYGYSPRQLSDNDLASIVAWLNGRSDDSPFAIPADKRLILLAFRRDGRLIGGAEGLIQMVVAFDESAGRFSHWVEAVEVR